GWPSGLYGTLTFTGTRPGGAIAAAWAVMQFLGQSGYRELARTVMDARERLIAGLNRIEGMHVWGDPDLWAVGFGAESYDILAVAEAMIRRGWVVGRIVEPRGIHLMLTPVHAPVIDEFLTDLRASADEVRGAGARASEGRVVY